MNPILKSKFLPICFLIGVGFFVYASALPNAFVWDDEEQIVHNSAIQSFSNTIEIFKGSTFTSGGGALGGGFYRPLVSLSYLLDYHVFGLQAWGFHAVQIALHLLNVVLLFFLLQKLFKAKSDLGTPKSDLAAFLAALLFAVHPANVEAVSYVASAGEVLFALFCILALREIVNFGAKGVWWFFIFAFAGLLSKETAVVILPISLIYFLSQRQNIRFYAKFVAGSIGMLGAYSALRFFSAKIPLGQFHTAPIAQATVFQRILTIPYELVSYVKTLFLPFRLSISQHFVVYSALDIRFWGSLLFLGVLGVFLFIFLMRQQKGMRNIYVFGLLWFLFGITPAIQPFIPLDMTIAERWLYFPAIGIFLCLGLLIMQVWNVLKGAWFKIFIVILACIFLAFSIRTMVRNSNWRNGLSLYSHDIQYSKNSFELENNYGVELFRAGKADAAKSYFERSIALQSKWTYPHNNLGAVLESEGKFNEALAEYKKSIELSDYYLAYENEASLLLRTGNQAEAQTFIESALLKLPYNAKLNFLLAVIYYKEQKPQSEIIPLLQRAIVSDPANAQVQQFYNLLRSGAKIQIQ